MGHCCFQKTRFIKQKFGARHEILPQWLFIKEPAESPKTTQAIPNALGCLLELNGKASLWLQDTEKPNWN